MYEHELEIIKNAFIPRNNLTLLPPCEKRSQCAMVGAKDASGNHLYILVIHSDNECLKTIIKMRTLLNSVLKEIGEKHELLMAIPPEFVKLESPGKFRSTNTQKIFGEYQEMFSHMSLTSVGTFALDLPRHVLSAKHRVVPHSEVVEYSSFIVDPARILASDRQIVWCRAKVGDIIEITYDSPTAVEAVEYRIVVDG